MPKVADGRSALMILCNRSTAVGEMTAFDNAIGWIPTVVMFRGRASTVRLCTLY